MTQAQLAARAEMERTDVNAAENGRLALGQDRLGRLAAALEVSVLELDAAAEPDAQGLSLLARLEELEAVQARDTVRFDRLLRAVTRRLAALEEAQATRARSVTRPQKDEEAAK